MKFVHTSFLSRVDAETASREASSAHIALISIDSPTSKNDAPNVAGFWQPLMLKFHDVGAPPNYPYGIGNWDAEREFAYRKKYVLFDEFHAGQILDYLLAAEIAEQVFQCWVHCQAGVSRSAAVVKFIADIYKLWYPPLYHLHNEHVYKTLWDVYNQRIIEQKQIPGLS